VVFTEEGKIDYGMSPRYEALALAP